MCSTILSMTLEDSFNHDCLEFLVQGKLESASSIKEEETEETTKNVRKKL